MPLLDEAPSSFEVVVGVMGEGADRHASCEYQKVGTPPP
jgi:hypothetical protein